eukprot:s23_g21.t1
MYCTFPRLSGSVGRRFRRKSWELEHVEGFESACVLRAEDVICLRHARDDLGKIPGRWKSCWSVWRGTRRQRCGPSSGPPCSAKVALQKDHHEAAVASCISPMSTRPESIAQAIPMRAEADRGAQQAMENSEKRDVIAFAAGVALSYAIDQVCYLFTLFLE